MLNRSVGMEHPCPDRCICHITRDPADCGVRGACCSRAGENFFPVDPTPNLLELLAEYTEFGCEEDMRDPVATQEQRAFLCQQSGMEDIEPKQDGGFLGRDGNLKINMTDKQAVFVALRRMIPPNFAGIKPDSGSWQSTVTGYGTESNARSTTNTHPTVTYD